MTLLSALMIVVGLVGIVAPVLPGLLLVWGGAALWAVARHDSAGWVVLAVVTLIAIVGSVVKYLVPGRRLREAGVPWTTVGLGTLLGVLGFFVVPLVGLPLGFVLGIYLAELARLRDRNDAWPSTRSALAAVGWSILIELGTALLIALGWLAAVILAP